MGAQLERWRGSGFSNWVRSAAITLTGGYYYLYVSTINSRGSELRGGHPTLKRAKRAFTEEYGSKQCPVRWKREI